jgi:AcrR family transcriptional regulator
MTTIRNSKDDVVAAAGRLFAERGYHGTSMRDLARELGLHGSSLYSHVDSKEDLLVAVVERGAGLFEASADAALAAGDSPDEQLLGLIRGHIDVVLDHRDEARTFLNEASVLDGGHRARIVAARDRYEAAFRATIAEGIESGTFRTDTDVALTSIFLLSILNAIDRWYDETGRLDRTRLAGRIHTLVVAGLTPSAP